MHERERKRDREREMVICCDERRLSLMGRLLHDGEKLSRMLWEDLAEGVELS